MIGHVLTKNERALLREYEAASKADGFDGIFALEPHERGVVVVASHVGAEAAVRMLKSLGLKGQEARDAWMRFTYAEPIALDMVDAEFRELTKVAP